MGRFAVAGVFRSPSTLFGASAVDTRVRGATDFVGIGPGTPALAKIGTTANTAPAAVVSSLFLDQPGDERMGLPPRADAWIVCGGFDARHSFLRRPGRQGGAVGRRGKTVPRKYSRFFRRQPLQPLYPVWRGCSFQSRGTRHHYFPSSKAGKDGGWGVCGHYQPQSEPTNRGKRPMRGETECGSNISLRRARSFCDVGAPPAYCCQVYSPASLRRRAISSLMDFDDFTSRRSTTSFSTCCAFVFNSDFRVTILG